MPATIAEPARGLFRRAKAAMKGDNTALEAALAELRRLVLSQQAEKDQSNKAMAALSQYGQRSQAAAHAFNHSCGTGTTEEIQSSFQTFVRAKACAAEAQQIVIGLTRESYHDTGAQWSSQHPDAKPNLLRVAGLRLAVAKDKAAAMLEREQARMGDQFDGHDSPVYKREAARVSALEAVLNRIQSQPIQDVFANTASTLLSWDE